MFSAINSNSWNHTDYASCLPSDGVGVDEAALVKAQVTPKLLLDVQEVLIGQGSISELLLS